jgi:DNA polymerase elongation subunit (family B)
MSNETFYVYKARAEDVNNSLVLRLYGITKTGQTILVTILDYAYYIYLEAAEGRWTRGRQRKFMERLSKYLNANHQNHAPVEWHFVEKKRLYNAVEADTSMVMECFELYFDSLEAGVHCKRLVNKCFKEEIAATYEVDASDVDPIKKMMVARDLTYCCWFDAPLEPVQENERVTNSSDILEYTCSWSDLNRSNEETQKLIPQFKILGFDIETESSEDGMPEKWRPGDTVYLKSCIFQEIGKPATRKRYGITFLDYADIDKQFCEIYKVKNEFDIFNVFGELIEKHQPHIFTGHNINGYDWDYIDSRIHRRPKARHEWPVLGMLSGVKRKMIEKRWNSSGAGDMKLRYPDADGRLVYDTYNYFLRNFKLVKYDLDTVAKKFFEGEGKHQLPPSEQQRIVRDWRRWKRDRKEGNERMEIEEEKREKIRIDNLWRKVRNRKRQKKMLDGEEEELEEEGLPTEKFILNECKRLIEYCVQDAELTVRLFDKVNIHINVGAMANMASVPAEDILTGGEQRKCRSVIYTLAHREGYVFTPHEKMKRDKYEGALVQDPVTGLWDVICLDFSSMYPSNIMAYNICLTTIIPKGIKFDKDKVHKIIDEHGKYTGIRFLSQTVREGLVPKCARMLVEKRKWYKDWMEQFDPEGTGKPNVPDQFKMQYAIYNAMQDKIKVIANSLYGFMGAETNPYSLYDGAAAITAIGRWLISIVNKHVIEKYGGRVIYGDTDSVMFYINKSPAEFYNLGRTLADEITKQVINRPPIKIAYEKSMRICILKKKFYAAALFDKKGEPDLRPEKIMCKGVMSARRDYCKWGQELFNSVVLVILSGLGLIAALNKVVQGVKDLVEDKVPPGKLSIVKRVTSKAKDTFWVKQIAIREVAAGEQIGNGDRIEFVYVHTMGEDGKESKKSSEKAVLLHKFDREYMEIHKVDYVEKQLKQFEDLLTKAYPDEFEILNELEPYYPRTTAKHKVPFNRPIRMLARIVEDKEPPETILQMMSPKKLFKLQKKPAQKEQTLGSTRRTMKLIV